MNAQCTCLFMLSENKQIKDRGYQLMLSFYQLARGPLTFFECGPLVHLFEYPCCKVCSDRQMMLNSELTSSLFQVCLRMERDACPLEAQGRSSTGRPLGSAVGPPPSRLSSKTCSSNCRTVCIMLGQYI